MTISIIKSADRALKVLEHFRETRRPALASELRCALDLPQSSTSMLLRSMVAMGYLDYVAETRTFVPTLRVALLGDWLYAEDMLTSTLVDALRDLQQRTGETVVLGRQNGVNVQYLSLLQADPRANLVAKVGSTRPMILSALGQVLLTTKRPDEVKLIIRRNNAEASQTDWGVDERTWVAKLETIRTQGYAVSDAIVTPRARLVAMLLPVEMGSLPLAIGVGGSGARICENLPRIVEALRATAAAMDVMPAGGAITAQAS